MKLRYPVYQSDLHCTLYIVPAQSPPQAPPSFQLSCKCEKDREGSLYYEANLYPAWQV